MLAKGSDPFMNRPWLQRLRRILSIVQVAERSFLALMLGGILILMSLTVAQRYWSFTSQIWFAELSRFMLIWLTFLGAGYLLSLDKHVALVISHRLVTDRVSVVLKLISTFAVLVLSVIVAIGGASFVAGQWALLSPALAWPMALVYGSATVGFWLLAAHAVVRILLLICDPLGQEKIESMTSETAV